MSEGSLEAVLEAAFSYYMSSVYTCLPCIVLTVNMADLRVDVQPVINRLNRDLESAEHPPILNIPLWNYSSSTSAISFPVNVGDTVLCVFFQRSSDAFKSSLAGKPANPLDFRRFDKRDAVALPCVWPWAKSVNNPNKHHLPHSTKDLVITHNLGTSNESEIRMLPNGDIKVKSPTKFQVDAPNATINCTTANVTASSSLTVSAPTTTWTGNINLTGNLSVTGNYSVTGTSTYNGNITMTGTFTLGGIVINTHYHGGVQTGGGNTGVMA